MSVFVTVGNMMALAAEASGTLGGSALASWTPITTLLVAYALVVALLWWRGDPADGDKAPLGALQGSARGGVGRLINLHFKLVNQDSVLRSDPILVCADLRLGKRYRALERLNCQAP